MKKLLFIFGIVIGVFIILVPAFAEMKNPIAAWIFFPLFGIFIIVFVTFAFLRNK